MESLPETNSTDLKQELLRLKQKCDILEKENKETSDLFEEKRSKFKEVYHAKEKTVAEQITRMAAMEDTIRKMQIEIDDNKMIASVSENTKQEAVERLNKRHFDEIESLRKAMEDSNEESQQEMIRHFERERRQWEKKFISFNSEKEQLERDLERLRERKYGGLSEEEELEVSMKKAHEESEKLKSVVVPLEQEITKLKQDLASTKKELLESQQTMEKLREKSREVSLISPDTAKDTAIEENDKQSAVTMIALDLALTSKKSDRETYIDVLSAQKRQAEHSNSKLKEMLQNVRKQFEVEKAEHAVLKQTWLAANDQFLESQRLLMRDLNINESVLSEDQKRQVKMLKLKAQANEARPKESTIKSPMSSHALLKQKTEKFKEAATDSVSMKSDTESETPSFGSFQDFQDATESDRQDDKLNLSTMTIIETDSKSNTTLMPESEQFNATTLVPGPGQKVVSIREWEDLLQELMTLRKKTKHHADVSQSSFSNLFEDDAKVANELNDLKKQLKIYKDENERQRRKTVALEESIQCSAEDAQKQITDLVQKLADFERLIGNLNEQRIITKAEDVKKLLEQKKETEVLCEGLSSLKRERDKLLLLKGKHEQNLAKENLSMPKSIEGLRNLINMYREALATARAERENNEAKLRREVLVLQQNVKDAQAQKIQLESSLASELHDARCEILSLQSLKSVKEELAQANLEKKELEMDLEKNKTSMEALRSKSSEIIRGLREKHLEEIKAKEGLEATLAEAKNRFRSLQSALETSEHVQRDFVRLSQSLQVQLEQVREEREQEKAVSAETSSVNSVELSSPSLSVSSPSEVRQKSPSPKSKRKT